MSHSFSIYRDAISPFFLPPTTSCLSLFSSLPYLPSAHNSFLLTSGNINTAYYTGFKWKASKVEMSVFISGISLADLEDWFLFSSVQLLSCVQLCATPWTVAHQASMSITNSLSLLKLRSIKLVMPSNHLILCRSFLLPPSIFPSVRVFSKDSVLCIRWPKYWSFRFSITPSNEYSGLISSRIGWLDLLAVQKDFQESTDL